MSKDLFKESSLQKLFKDLDRGGTRGGKDQFTWDSIKNDKDRSYYLGHGVMVPVGRWCKDRDIFWYTKGKAGSQNPEAELISNKESALKKREEELKAVQANEKQLMLESLGLAPKRAVEKEALTAAEIQKVLARGQGDFAESRVQGLGFTPAMMHDAMGRDKPQINTLTSSNAEQIAKMAAEQQSSRLKGISLAASSAASAISDAASELKANLSEKELKLLLKQHEEREKELKKERKAEKKLKKEAKEERKKEKKEHKEKKHSRSRSRSPVRGREKEHKLKTKSPSPNRHAPESQRDRDRSRSPYHRRSRSRSNRRYRSRSRSPVSRR